MSLWNALSVLMSLAVKKGITLIQLFGDSKLVIDWVKGTNWYAEFDFSSFL